MRAERPVNPTILFVFLLPYLFATLFHHIHNAEFLKERGGSDFSDGWVGVILL